MSSSKVASMTEDDVDRFLKAEGLWQGAPSIKVMKGGYINTVMRVTTGSRRLVLKQFEAAMTGTLFPNLPADEAKALDRLSGFDVAPALIGFWPQQSVLAYSYVEGTHWDGDLEAVAALLARKENADATGFRRVPTDASDILAEGDALFARCRVAHDHPRPVVRQIEPPLRLSLIHTDMGASNLIGTGAGLRLIDWQCPAQGDLCEDVHSFISPAFQILSLRAPLPAVEVARFFTALDMPGIAQRYRRLRPAFAWRMAAYCLWRAEILSDPEVCARYRTAALAELSEMGHAQ